MKKWMRVVIAFGFVTIFGCSIAVGLLLFESKVYSGVSIEGIHVGGISREDMTQLLAVWQKQQQNKKIMLYYGDTRFHVEPQQLAYSLDIDTMVEEAWNVGRRGTLWERLKHVNTANQSGYRVPMRIRYDETKLSALLAEWQQVIDRPSRNAALSIARGGITPQEMGRQLAVEDVRPLVIQALKSTDTVTAPLPVRSLEPEITLADIRQAGIREALASFTTEFDGKEINRSANIAQAAHKINGIIVYPGRVFSFNETVGPRDKAHGFKEALEIVDGEFVPGIGGGVCQVSSTLYNAVILSNMEVAERYNHSKPLGYVALGRDATVVYGVLDFKFVNTSNSPVMVMAEVEGNRLHVGLFGSNYLREAVEVLAVDKQIIPPGIVKKQDHELYLGETKVAKQGKPGYEVTTIRIVRIGDKEVKREMLAKDRYLPDNTVVRVGVRMPPFVQDQVRLGSDGV